MLKHTAAMQPWHTPSLGNKARPDSCLDKGMCMRPNAVYQGLLCMCTGCAIGVNDMRNPLRPVLRALPFLPEARSIMPLF